MAKDVQPYKVYMHTSPSGKRYIGITRQEPQKRFGYNGIGYKECPLFYKAIKKYGWKSIKHEILFDGLTKEEAEMMEVMLIRSYRSNDREYGYNIENGGNCPGTHSEETKKKISAANKGRSVSCETREKLSKALKGKHVGENNPSYGKHIPKHLRDLHSKFMKGNQYNKGHHHSEEYKRMKSQQMKEKYSNGKNPRCKVICGYDENGEERARYYSLREAARKLNISAGWLCTSIKKNSKVSGLEWRFENE